MLTFRSMAAGAPAQAAAMAAYLGEQNLGQNRQALAAYYLGQPGVPKEMGEALRDTARDVAEGKLGADDAAAFLARQGGPPDDVGRAAAEAALRDALVKTAEIHQPGGGGISTARLRQDMAPAMAAALGVDPRRGLTEVEVARLLEGKRADGTELEGRTRKISAIDLTLSADKSVSIAWAFAPSEAERAIIEGVHREAVRLTMEYIAREIGWARIGDSGKDGAERGHVGWMSFDHYASRPTVDLVVGDAKEGGQVTAPFSLPRVAGDMNLHTHSAMFNLVMCDSGRVGSLDQARLHGRIHEFGGYYQAQMATLGRRAGIPMVLDRKTGAARIAGISDRVREAFSKRSTDALAAAREYAIKEGFVATAREWDALSDETKIKLIKGGAGERRQTKDDGQIDFAAWRKQAAKLKYDHRSVVGNARIEPGQEPERIARARDASMEFVAADFERRSVVSGWDMRAAAVRGLVESGITGPEDIDRVTRTYREWGIEQAGKLTQIIWGQERGERGLVNVTTQMHVDQERELIRLAQSAAQDRHGDLPAAAIEAAVRQSGLDKDDPPNSWGGSAAEWRAHITAQRSAINTLGAGGRLAVVIGSAGSGKTTMLRPVVTAWKGNGRQVYGIAQAWRQSDDLVGAGVAKADTMAMVPFLKRAEEGKLALGPQTVVVLDELGQVGARQMLGLLRLREQYGFSLVAVGDNRQCQSIEAGPVVDLLRQALGEKAIPEILTTIRQLTERERDTTTMLREGRAADALARKMEDGTVEVVPGGYKEAVERTADLWVERRAANKDDPTYTLSVSAPTNADARAISEAIRERRRAAGELGADLAVLRATDQSGGGRFDLAVAQGDRVRLFNRVWGETQDGRRVPVGNNGTVVTVADATSEGIIFRAPGGALARVPLDELRDKASGRVRLTYGDALTIDASQGITTTEHIAASPGGTQAVNGFKGYTSLSRHRRSTVIVTSDGAERKEVAGRRPLGDDRAISRQDVIDNMARNLSRQPEKVSALEFLRRAISVQRGAVRGLTEAHQRIETRAAARQPVTTLRQQMTRQRDEAALARAMVEVRRSLQERGHALGQVAAQVAQGAPTGRPAAGQGTGAPKRSPSRPAPPAAPTTAASSAADLKLQREKEKQEVRAALQNNAEGIVDKLMGKPTTKGSQWRYGKSDSQSLRVAVRGPKAGQWYDNATKSGGDLLALIEKRLGLDFPAAMTWARNELGMPQPEKAKTLSPQDRAQMAAHMAKLQETTAQKAAADAAALLARHETVARRASAIWERSPPATADHPYLARKDVQPHGIKLDPRGRLRIAMQDETGKIWSLQHIDPVKRAGRTDKLFHYHARADRLFAVLGEIQPSKPIAFAEGFATGADVHQATGLATVVTFSVGNKEKVMTAWREREPDRMLIDAADNDHSKERFTPPKPNAGKEMAEKLRAQIGAVPALPPFQSHENGSDWNDFRKKHGYEAVRASIRSSVQRALDERSVDAAQASQALGRQARKRGMDMER